ncbi:MULTISPECIES: RcpC/CpaB family pilus assembly protein [Streptomyces]|uniref:RcpC/CpaB family pilus assembly protein n=1 Tax=Streptomyces TaxID=1883 RepID=UPI0020C07023|nr:RcpC/CpaB family pilus assembly protein [Streptomyces sp. 43Y-GA-1]MCL6290400.1 RcpC/CpaB family pilus assembly protein [Streptomyces sp. 43Y-GA-1]
MSTSSPLSPSSSLTTSALPAPVPAPGGVGPFGPLRVRGGGAHRLRRMLRRQRRAAAAGLALAGAALATTGLSSADGGAAAAPDAPPGAGRSSGRLVAAPVRIADPETVRLLRPGDRVDVIAVGDTGGDDARVVARGARVAKVPRAAAGPGGHAASGGGEAGSGALVVLSVERSTATALLGAGTSGRLAVAVSDAN